MGKPGKNPADLGPFVYVKHGKGEYPAFLVYTDKKKEGMVLIQWSDRGDREYVRAENVTNMEESSSGRRSRRGSSTVAASTQRAPKKQPAASKKKRLVKHAPPKAKESKAKGKTKPLAKAKKKDPRETVAEFDLHDTDDEQEVPSDRPKAEKIKIPRKKSQKSINKEESDGAVDELAGGLRDGATNASQEKLKTAKIQTLRASAETHKDQPTDTCTMDEDTIQPTNLTKASVESNKDQPIAAPDKDKIRSTASVTTSVETSKNQPTATADKDRTQPTASIMASVETNKDQPTATIEKNGTQPTDSSTARVETSKDRPTATADKNGTHSTDSIHKTTQGSRSHQEAAEIPSKEHFDDLTGHQDALARTSGSAPEANSLDQESMAGKAGCETSSPDPSTVQKASSQSDAVQLTQRKEDVNGQPARPIGSEAEQVAKSNKLLDAKTVSQTASSQTVVVQTERTLLEDSSAVGTAGVSELPSSNAHQSTKESQTTPNASDSQTPKNAATTTVDASKPFPKNSNISQSRQSPQLAKTQGETKDISSPHTKKGGGCVAAKEPGKATTKERQGQYSTKPIAEAASTEPAHEANPLNNGAKPKSHPEHISKQPSQPPTSGASQPQPPAVDAPVIAQKPKKQMVIFLSSDDDSDDDEGETDRKVAISKADTSTVKQEVSQNSETEGTREIEGSVPTPDPLVNNLAPATLTDEKAETSSASKKGSCLEPVHDTQAKVLAVDAILEASSNQEKSPTPETPHGAASSSKEDSISEPLCEKDAPVSEDVEASPNQGEITCTEQPQEATAHDSELSKQKNAVPCMDMSESKGDEVEPRLATEKVTARSDFSERSSSIDNGRRLAAPDVLQLDMIGHVREISAPSDSTQQHEPTDNMVVSEKLRAGAVDNGEDNSAAQDEMEGKPTPVVHQCTEEPEPKEKARKVTNEEARKEVTSDEREAVAVSNKGDSRQERTNEKEGAQQARKDQQSVTAAAKGGEAGQESSKKDARQETTDEKEGAQQASKETAADQQSATATAKEGEARQDSNKKDSRQETTDEKEGAEQASVEITVHQQSATAAVKGGEARQETTPKQEPPHQTCTSTSGSAPTIVTAAKKKITVELSSDSDSDVENLQENLVRTNQAQPVPADETRSTTVPRKRRVEDSANNAHLTISPKKCRAEESETKDEAQNLTGGKTADQGATSQVPTGALAPIQRNETSSNAALAPVQANVTSSKDAKKRRRTLEESKSETRNEEIYCCVEQFFNDSPKDTTTVGRIIEMVEDRLGVNLSMKKKEDIQRFLKKLAIRHFAQQGLLDQGYHGVRTAS